MHDATSFPLIEPEARSIPHLEMKKPVPTFRSSQIPLSNNFKRTSESNGPWQDNISSTPFDLKSLMDTRGLWCRDFKSAVLVQLRFLADRFKIKASL
ncbi:hypothetical protein [Bradyrhizobium sp.]|uniref:hypothetical protein n=1 Tax=Bradyrhizobium sp. TaxID=376 RepID=UPI0026092EA6|nr:hypothetical protein [Bradyrhizobium sp.]